MLNFNSLHSAENTLTGIERMHMIRKGQMTLAEGVQMTFAEQFTHWQHKFTQFSGPHAHWSKFYISQINATEPEMLRQCFNPLKLLKQLKTL